MTMSTSAPGGAAAGSTVSASSLPAAAADPPLARRKRTRSSPPIGLRARSRWLAAASMPRRCAELKCRCGEGSSGDLKGGDPRMLQMPK